MSFWIQSPPKPLWSCTSPRLLTGILQYNRGIYIGETYQVITSTVCEDGQQNPSQRKSGFENCPWYGEKRNTDNHTKLKVQTKWRVTLRQNVLLTSLEEHSSHLKHSRYYVLFYLDVRHVQQLKSFVCKLHTHYFLHLLLCLYFTRLDYCHHWQLFCFCFLFFIHRHVKRHADEWRNKWTEKNYLEDDVALSIKRLTYLLLWVQKRGSGRWGRIWALSLKRKAHKTSKRKQKQKIMERKSNSQLIFTSLPFVQK